MVARWSVLSAEYWVLGAERSMKEQALHGSARWHPVSQKPRGKDAGVVGDQQIPPFDERGEISD